VSKTRKQKMEIQDLPAEMKALSDDAAARARGGMTLAHEETHAEEGTDWGQTGVGRPWCYCPDPWAFDY
jgi:hypothetical protein